MIESSAGADVMLSRQFRSVAGDHRPPEEKVKMGGGLKEWRTPILKGRKNEGKRGDLEKKLSATANSSQIRKMGE